MGYVIVAIVAIAVAVFAMQNTNMVTVRFILWQVPEVPVAALVLASLGVGILIVGMPLAFKLWRARSRVRALSAAPPPQPPTPDRPSPTPDRPIEG